MKEPQRGKEECDLRGREGNSKDANMGTHIVLSWDNEQVSLAEAHSSADAEKQWNEQIGRRERGCQGRFAHTVMHP